MEFAVRIPLLSCGAVVLLASACRSIPQEPPPVSAPTETQEVRHDPDMHTGLVHGFGASPAREVPALERELQALEAEYREGAQPELERRYARGQYEVVATDGRLLPEHLPPGEVASAFLLPRGEVRKVTLPPREFAELHELRARLDALRVQLAQARPTATRSLGNTS